MSYEYNGYKNYTKYDDKLIEICKLIQPCWHLKVEEIRDKRTSNSTYGYNTYDPVNEVRYTIF